MEQDKRRFKEEFEAAEKTVGPVDFAALRVREKESIRRHSDALRVRMLENMERFWDEEFVG